MNNMNSIEDFFNFLHFIHYSWMVYYIMIDFNINKLFHYSRYVCIFYLISIISVLYGPIWFIDSLKTYLFIFRIIIFSSFILNIIYATSKHYKYQKYISEKRLVRKLRILFKKIIKNKNMK